MNASPDSVVQMSDDVVFRELAGGGGVLLNLVTGQYHQVNDTGAQVCTYLATPHTVADVQIEIARRHPDAGPAVADDVASFVSDMLERNLFANR